LAKGLEGEIHRIELPVESVADALLADLIFRHLSDQLRQSGIIPLLEKGGSLWVVGNVDSLRTLLQEYTVDPRALYQTADIDDSVFENMLTSSSMPKAGSLQPVNLRFLLLNERIAQRMAAQLALRRTAKQAMEHFDISIAEVTRIFDAPPTTSVDDSTDEWQHED
jgi:hypothetical protein